ncbi:MAG TPA: hypothetical protein VIK86_09105 [Candidatus Paceibacterota bacterium]
MKKLVSTIHKNGYFNSTYSSSSNPISPCLYDLTIQMKTIFVGGLQID